MTSAFVGFRRKLLSLAALLAVLVGLHRGAREAVAHAVALAPNAGKHSSDLEPMRLPAPLAERGAFVLRTEVRAPDAELVSWVAPGARDSQRGTVVLLHGVRMDKRSLLPLGLSLSDAGFRVVLLDLRGHGESTGSYLTYGQEDARDVKTVLDALAVRVTLGPVGVYGFSYGGAAALATAAADPRVRAVVAVSAFASLRGVIVDYERKYLPGPLSLIPDSWFQTAVDRAAELAQFDPDARTPLAAAADCRDPVLLIHGLADTQVPSRHSRELARAAGSRARLVLLPHETHATMPLDATGAIRRETVAWFERWLAD